MSDTHRFVQRSVALLLVALVLGAVLTPPDPFAQVYYATGAVPVALVTAYVLVYRTEAERFPRFLAVAVAGAVLIWVVGTMLSPSSIGIGAGWIALAAAFVAAYAVVYSDERAIRGSSME